MPVVANSIMPRTTRNRLIVTFKRSQNGKRRYPRNSRSYKFRVSLRIFLAVFTFIFRVPFHGGIGTTFPSDQPHWVENTLIPGWHCASRTACDAIAKSDGCYTSRTCFPSAATL
jgi:hypothetical protein